jgi:hypothetical protein
MSGVFVTATAPMLETRAPPWLCPDRGQTASDTFRKQRP